MEDYSVQYQLSCECMAESTRPARVIVRGGRVAEVTDVQTGTARNIESYMTVDALFARIREAFE